MQRANVTVYKHAGIEMARIPGSEKLRVRQTKDQGDADVSSGTTTSDNAGDAIAGDVLDQAADAGAGEQ